MEKRMTTARTCEEYVLNEMEELKEELEEVDAEYQMLALDFHDLAEKYMKLLGLIKLEGEGLDSERYSIDAWKLYNTNGSYDFIKSLKEELTHDTEPEAEASEA